MAEQLNSLSPTTITLDTWKQMERRSRRENLGRAWYKFTRNPLSLVGLVTVSLVIFMAVFAPYVTPYPEHAGPFTDFANAKQSPSLQHPFGTDTIGRDVFTRTIFGFRFSLTMGIVVLTLVVPPGVLLGLLAGYYHGTWIDSVVMRITAQKNGVPILNDHGL